MEYKDQLFSFIDYTSFYVKMKMQINFIKYGSYIKK